MRWLFTLCSGVQKRRTCNYFVFVPDVVLEQQCNCDGCASFACRRRQETKHRADRAKSTAGRLLLLGVLYWRTVLYSTYSTSSTTTSRVVGT